MYICIVYKYVHICMYSIYMLRIYVIYINLNSGILINHLSDHFPVFYIKSVKTEKKKKIQQLQQEL